MIKYTLDWRVGNISGRYHLSSDPYWHKHGLEEPMRKMVLNYLQLAGVDLNLADVEVLSFGRTKNDENTDNEVETKFTFVKFKSGKGSGPWHMLAGTIEVGGLSCGANRKMTSATGTETGDWPKGKHCVKCRKIWKAKLKDK